MKIHAMTLSWNGLDKLKRLMPGLCASLSYITHSNGELKYGLEPSEWYIRDNGSKDGTIETISKWHDPEVKITPIAIDHNRNSFAEGMNFLFKRAKPADDDIVLLLNNDVVIEDKLSLSHMLNLMQQTKAGVVGARLLYSTSRSLQHAGVIFGPKYGNMPFHFRPNETPDINSAKNRYFQAVTAAVCMVRAGSYRRIGGMDENYQWAFEDIDMCLQIGKTEKIVYCGNTLIVHEESATLVKNPVNKMFMAKNVQHFKEKWWNQNGPRYVLDHHLYSNDVNYNEIKSQ